VPRMIPRLLQYVHSASTIRAHRRARSSLVGLAPLASCDATRVSEALQPVERIVCCAFSQEGMRQIRATGLRSLGKLRVPLLSSLRLGTRFVTSSTAVGDAPYRSYLVQYQ